MGAMFDFVGAEIQERRSYRPSDRIIALRSRGRNAPSDSYKITKALASCELQCNDVSVFTFNNKILTKRQLLLFDYSY